MKFLLVTYPDLNQVIQQNMFGTQYPRLKVILAAQRLRLLKRSLSSLANSWATRLALLGSSRGWKAWAMKW
jgi:hypothetical protein